MYNLNFFTTGMTLDNFSEDPTQIGAMLFHHCCSGVR